MYKHFSLAAAMALIAINAASAQDLDCRDFRTRADAQAAHERDPSLGLDADNDGIACERGVGVSVDVRQSAPDSTGVSACTGYGGWIPCYCHPTNRTGC